MKNNRTTLPILAMVLVCFLCIGGIAHAQSVAELYQKMEKAEDLVDEKEADHDTATAHLNEQIANFVRLHGHLVEIELPSQSPATNTLSLTAKVVKIVAKLINTHQLTSVMERQLAAIETQRGICNGIWADVVLAQTAYEDAVDAYNAAVSPEERVPTDPMPTPTPPNNLYLCKGPCSMAFTTQVLATTTHKVFCQVPPHKNSGYSYYSCPPDYENTCPAKAFHQTPCGGGCGTLFAKNTGTRPRADDVHRTQCNERTSRNIFNGWTGNCIGDYYSCNGQTSADCSNVSQHISGSSSSNKGCANNETYNYCNDQGSCSTRSTSGVPGECGHNYCCCTSGAPLYNGGGSGSTPPTDNTPNCQDCTSDCGSPCSCTNSGTCGGTVATPPPPPPPPTTVACGGASYSGCSGAPSRTAHHVPSCSKGCGNGYWTCDSDAVSNHEAELTCRRCGTTFTRCSNGACSSGYPYHWAQ